MGLLAPGAVGLKFWRPYADQPVIDVAAIAVSWVEIEGTEADLAGTNAGTGTATGIGTATASGHRILSRAVTAAGSTNIAVYNKNLPGLSAENFQNLTLVSVVPASNLVAASGSIARIVVSFGTGTAGLSIPIYFGQAAAAGDAYDFLNTPTRVLFSGADFVTVAATTQFTSDWFTLPEPFDPSKSYCVAGNFPNAFIGVFNTAATGHAGYTKSGADAATVNKTGYAQIYTDVASFVHTVEVQPVAVGAAFDAKTVTAAGTSTATAATGTAIRYQTVTAAGAGAAIATGQSFFAATATAAGTGTATAFGGQVGVNLGYAPGLGTAAATGSSTAAGSMVAAATSTATATGQRIVFSAAAASATATSTAQASGRAFVAGAANALGTSTAAAASRATVARIGNAAGLGSAQAGGQWIVAAVAAASGIGQAQAVGLVSTGNIKTQYLTAKRTRTPSITGTKLPPAIIAQRKAPATWIAKQ